MANTEQGDDYIRRFAAFIRSHEQSLASAGFVPRTRHHSTSQSEPYNLLSWVTPSQPQRHTSPVVLSIDPHHLSYILMRMEALGLNVGDMDVKLETPLKQNAYMSLLAAKDRDAQSIFSIRSTLSAVSKLSLGPSLGWLMGGAVQPPSLDTELKHMYSLMTLLPALSLHAFSARMITELAEDPPVDNALPLDVFKSLQSLEMTDVDPRDYIGWDQLSIGLRSFTIRRSSVEDVSDVLVDAVANDMVRRKGDLKTPVKNRPRLIHHASSIRSQHPSISPDGLPHSPPAEAPPPTLPAYTWASLRHLALPDNALTFFPSAPTPYLSALQSLDLSSNLLVSLPPCLSQIPTLTHLSVAHNMLDSILGIGALLPEVRSLNLSHNRLDSLCGLERLPRLRFADLRSNALEDSAEVGRLSQCMEIEDVWIEDNMFCRTEPDWRVRVFELFRREGREVKLDGTGPTWTENMYISSPSPAHLPSLPPPPVQAVQEPPATTITSSPPLFPHQTPSTAPAPRPTVTATIRPFPVPGTAPAPSSPKAQLQPKRTPGSPSTLAPTPKKRRPPVKRVVDLDGGAIPTNVRPTANDDQQSVMQHLRVSLSSVDSHLGPHPRSALLASPSPPPNPDAEAFRARIEALREEVGESWLRVLSQGKELGKKVTS